MSGNVKIGFFIILSQDEDHKSRLRAQFDDVMIAYGFAGKKFYGGIQYSKQDFASSGQDDKAGLLGGKK